MQKILFTTILLFAMMSTEAQTTRPCRTFLALGDSYTIGEGVPVYESFPYQAVQLFRKSGLPFCAPEIVAKTGWTTDELQAGIRETGFLPSYDLVTLLIGVNNQYRGRAVDGYAVEFESLLRQAIAFAGGDVKRVAVISIPDWGATPFAEGRDRGKIAAEIDAYNAVNRKISDKHGVHYIDITPGTRQAREDGTLVARDKLHPSGKEYSKWAAQLSARVAALR
jgi:lysophospholipase L1-like esterase